MENTVDQLPDDLDTCHRLIRELLDSLQKQTFLNEKLQHQLEQLLRQRYGQKAERIDPNQLLLFAREILEANGAAPPPTDAATPPNGQTAPAAAADATNPKKNGHGRKPLP